MTYDDAIAKVQAIWPEASLTSTPMSAPGVVKILIAFGVIKIDSEAPVSKTAVTIDEVAPSEKDKPIKAKKNDEKA